METDPGRVPEFGTNLNAAGSNLTVLQSERRELGLEKIFEVTGAPYEDVGAATAVWRKNLNLHASLSRRTALGP